MAMMITKFHKLIQSKTVWYVILGIIIIAFVGFFTPSMSSGSSQPKSREAGELFGEKVSMDEYHQAYQNSYIWYVLSSGQMVRISDEMARALHEQAWLRIAALRKAEQENILVANQEVVQQIQNMPAFRGQNGVFDVNIYKAILGQLGLTAPQVENLFREQLGIQKLMMRSVQAALIPPQELSRAYRLYTDRFILNYALLPREQVAEGVEVSREEAENYFAANAEAFRMPEKVRVSYVEFPVSEYLAQVELPEGEALRAYEQNLENYRIETTNETAAAEYRPFEEVEAEITAQLKQNVARRLAADRATEFVVAVSPKAEGAKADFAAAAADAGLAVKTSPAFGPADALPGIDETSPFRRVAFQLEDDVYSSFSDAVVGRDTVYVLSYGKKFPSFIPEFDAVEEKVMEAARREAATDALAAKALEIQDAVSKALALGSGFDEAIQPFGLSVERTSEFDLSEPGETPYADALLPACLNTEKGELCEPAPVAEGVLLAYVAERKSTDEEIGLPAVRQELVDGLERAYAQRLAAAWQASLLEEGELKDFAVQ